MKRGLRMGRSPAMIVAVVALLIAVGGTAVAGVSAISRLSKPEKKEVRKIAKAESDRGITRRAPGLTVGGAKTADVAGSAVRAANADHATSADRANSAGSANGVEPIKVVFTAAAGGSKTILAAGGLTISASCDGLGRTEVRFEPTPGGDLLDVVRTAGTEGTSSTQSFNQATFTSGFGFGTAGASVQLLTVSYLGTSGTTISGSLTLAQGASIAQCVVDGMLFEG